MPIDSTADLLFRIGANSDDAETNIKRFRTILTKDLGDIGAEFEQWTTHVLGSITTVAGAATAGAAALGAGLVALGAFANDAANKYADYVSEVARGTKTTGLSMEAMSGLKFAAEQTNTSYDSLVTGLTRFGSTIDKAANDTATYEKTFGRLHISQAAVAAGEKDMMPLLLQVADAFQGLGSKVERTAIARELFSRGGAELVTFLAQGSEGIQRLTEKAGEMGLLLGDEDKLNMLKYKASLKEMKELHEALEISVGRTMLPIKQQWEELKASVVQTLLSVGIFKGALAALTNPQEFFVAVTTNMAKIDAEIKKTAETMGKLGEDGLGAPKVKEAAQEWSGLADILEKVREKSEYQNNVDDRTAKDLAQIQIELDKATKKYNELSAAGKLTAEDAKAQAAALAQMPAALSALMSHYIAEINTKNAEAGADLRQRILHEGEQTVEVQAQLWGVEMAKLREKLVKEKADTAENLALLAELTRAGYAKIAQTKIDAIEKSGTEIERRIEAQAERSFEQRAADWNREINQQIEGYRKKQELTAQNEAMLEALRKAGLDKISREQTLAYGQEMARLAQHLEQINREHQTAAERIQAQYQVDVQKFSQAEEEKALRAAVGEAQRTAVVQMYAAIRAGLWKKEQQDLQALQNSQGWQGVFGAPFASMIRRNESLSKEWATSTNQSLMLVKVTMEGLKETAQDAFGQFSQGMGQNIASAIVYQKSIGEAMRAALASTLESLAAESITYAIYCTALGFTRLAQYDYPGASEAFTAAAIWGSVGGAAAVAGRFIAPSQGGSSASAAAGGSASTGTAASASAGSGASAQQVPQIVINVQGHLYGNADAVIDAINEAVLTRDKALTATNTTTGQVVRR